MTEPSNLPATSTADLLITIAGARPGAVEIAVGTEPAVRGDIVFPPGFDAVRTSERIRARMVGAMRDAVLRNRTPDVVLDVETVGQTLFQALFHDGAVLGRYEAWRRSGGGRIRLRLDAEAAQVAWELLRSKAPGAFFLATQADTMLVREVPSQLGRQEPAEVATGGLRVLACLSSPEGLPDLDIASERAFLEETLGGSGTVDWAPDNERDLRDKLSDPRADHHVFHFGGHGASKAEGGYIYLTRRRPPPGAPLDANGDPLPEYEEISAETLATDLRYCKSLRLVVLNACEGSAPGSESNAVSLAQRLVAAGIPAVLAMQSSILDGTAKEIVQEFYRRLARNEPIERAVNVLRQGLLAQGREWAAPVLTMSHPETPLFVAKATPPVVPPGKKPWKAILAAVAVVVGLLLIALVLAFFTLGPGGGEVQVTSVPPLPSGAPTSPDPATGTSSAPLPVTTPAVVPVSSTPSVSSPPPPAPIASAIVCWNTSPTAASANGFKCPSCPANYRGCTRAGTNNGVTTYRCRSCQ